MKESLKIANRSVNKLDGLSLATGRAKFTDDIRLEGMLIAKLHPSPHAHARILAIDTAEASQLPGVVCILTHEDLPRVPHTTAGQAYPESSPHDCTVLDRKVRFVGDRVAAVAAETREAAEQASRLIRVTYEVLPPVLETELATVDEAPRIHDETDSLRIADARHNVAAETAFHIGDNSFSEADYIFDRTYTTQYAQACPLEPHVTIAYLDEQDRIVIRTSTQVAFHVRRIVAHALRIPLKRIRVVTPRVGGSFGAKQEVLNEPLVAALALATRRPVKLELTRAEETAASRTRHPMIVNLRSGLKKDGTITDFDMDVISNAGANGSHAIAAARGAGSQALPLYRAKNVRFVAKAVYTTLPPGGASPGGGGTQGAFAMECLMDEMAERLGLDPLALRRQNHLREGEASRVFKALGESSVKPIASCGLARCIEQGAKAIGWSEKRGRPKGKGPLKRGVGVACLMHASSLPGIDMGAATIKMNEDGSFHLLIGAADPGTGSETILAQIAAEVLGVRESDIVVISGDTDSVPFDAGAHASSTTLVSGLAVKKAAEAVREQILVVAGKIAASDAAGSVLQDGMVVLPNGRRVTLAEVSLRSLYVLEPLQIQASSSHAISTSPASFAAHFCEVEVDEETGQVTVLRYVAAVDCGTAVNPRLVEGQTEGAVLNGIGYALVEEIAFDPRGRPRNPTWTHYKLYNTRDAPPIETILIPTWEPEGPYGAKSAGELSINGPLPCIANAIYDAIGIRMREAPFTAEKVLKALNLRAKGRRLE